jgi:hypothetical protein
VIVQTAPAGVPNLVIRQVDHAGLAAQFARAWGNATFEPLAPRRLMVAAVAHHDDGWRLVDDDPPRDPATGLPYQFTATPRPLVLEIHARSGERAERLHPFCGLLASMHTWGLYHGRYGLSERATIESISPAHRPAVIAMLQGELARQSRLQARLRAAPACAPWVEDAALFHNYKLLQFFDMLALYFNTHPAGQRRRGVFRRVPCSPGADLTVNVTPQTGAYRLAPYPFGADPLTVTCPALLLPPANSDAALRGAWRAAAVVHETIVLTSAE